MKGLLWCSLIPFAPDDFEQVLDCIMKDDDYKLMYDLEDSHIWKHQTVLV
jgi:hypothetical protein